MKHIKLFKSFFSPTSLTEEQKSWLDECAKGDWKLNRLTRLVDVDDNFYCSSQGLKDFKGVAFGHIKGYFKCSGNQLTSLVGAPQTVNGDFNCGFNKLTSLEGAPKTVDGDFNCEGNQLTSLVELPKSMTVRGGFYCNHNQLTSLEGAPKTVGAGLFCGNNSLTSLKGAPKTVSGGFYCKNNPISEKTLKSIFILMKNGKSYQQALEKFWPEMDNDDRVLMYKNHRSLTPEEIRKYQALEKINRIKGYL